MILMIDTTNTTINQVVQDTIDGTKITLDTLYVEIATIKDTLASVSQHTEPTTFLGINSGISNSWIGLFAFVVSCIAALYGYRSFKYQKKATEELKSLVPKRIPLLPFLKKLYDNTIVIRLVYDYTFKLPSEVDESNKSNKIDYDYAYLPWENLLTSALLPEALFDLSKYEKYDNPDIYISAVEMKLRWQEYNHELKIAIEEIKLDKIHTDRCDQLVSLTESIARHIMELDDMVCKAELAQFNIPYVPNKLEKELKEVLLCNFLTTIKEHFSFGSFRDNLTHRDIMTCTFCDDYSNIDVIYLSDIFKRSDKEPMPEYPNSINKIKTYLLGCDVITAVNTLYGISFAINYDGKKELTEPEKDYLLINESLDKVFGPKCAQQLNDFYSKGSIKFHDIIGYDIYLRICIFKQKYLTESQIDKEYERLIDPLNSRVIEGGDGTRLYLGCPVSDFLDILDSPEIKL